ncbi:tRNA (guanosine(37)-N1)-methyltransferase TrmD [Peptostreptococcus russellii]|uniref:tRNA (guanosine(37)-N1)-methyltransferase TrmD n=1 Tax=Peptostreptococcus russellii TaxID=215200 RepID=UPI0016289EEA|nr:tRNA (guanosine(37)-N1)-methyltransferase TrmD [Peptostreptococcus russellii]MBC2577580.1 tRNA (guanosine(37)-N1)-methyltransferase TrmD [Peptostreptococcus russellii]
MKISVMTLFPEIFESYLGESIMKRAIDKDILDVDLYNIRDFSENKHKKVDDYPFGGGAGMVMTPQPIYSTYKKILEDNNIEKARVIYLSPKGKTFDQKMAKSLAKEDNIVFLCGHYEGIDQRIIDMIVTDEVSIGDYVLTGGELPALVMIDSISRLIPGVLNRTESFEDESFENNLLEYPQYTRPREFEGLEVPEVILSGNHGKIDEWRLKEAEVLTEERRPDLWKLYKSKKMEEERLKKRKKRRRR